MGLILDGLKLPIERFQIEEVLEKRLVPENNTTIKDFFIITHGDFFHVAIFRSKFGNLPVFFCKEQLTTRVSILNRKKFDYPKEPSNLPKWGPEGTIH